MEDLKSELRQKNGLTRRQLMRSSLKGLTAWALGPVRSLFASADDDLEQVTHMTCMTRREGPLMVFQEYRTDPDVEIEQHIKRQLSMRKDLLGLLKKKIGCEKKVRLAVEDIQLRLVFIPQSNNDYEVAYHRYCLDITDTIFKMNRIDNFYTAITRPRKSYPQISKSGISAFLVHRLVKDFRAVCRFTAESGQRIRYAISGAIFSNHLGAVALEIQSLAPGRFELTRQPFTIWQNDTDNLYTLMSIPVEETLHYMLGKATDREISKVMQAQPPESLSGARQMAEDWMAVEESVVGGLVDRILKRYCAEHHLVLPDFLDDMKKTPMPSLHQYRYRERGIQLVKALGFEESMALYMESPSHFKEYLFKKKKIARLAGSRGNLLAPITV